MTLENQTVVIVGGSSGIGLGVAEALLAEGATIIIVGRSHRSFGLPKRPSGRQSESGPWPQMSRRKSK